MATVKQYKDILKGKRKTQGLQFTKVDNQTIRVTIIKGKHDCKWTIAIFLRLLANYKDSQELIFNDQLEFTIL